MGIEATFTVQKDDALLMLQSRGVIVYANDCNERLASLLYENRESIIENYEVVNDDYVFVYGDLRKYCW